MKSTFLVSCCAALLLAVVIYINPNISYSTMQQSATNQPPVVLYPNKTEYDNWLKSYGQVMGNFNFISESPILANGSFVNGTQGLGNASNIQVANSGNTSFVTFQIELGSKKHVFIAISNDRGMNYSQAKELTPIGTEDTNNLRIAAGIDSANVMWEAKNATSNKTNVWVSEYDNNNNTFRTYPINPNGDGKDGVPGANSDLYWLEKDPGNPCLPKGSNENHTGPFVVCQHPKW